MALRDDAIARASVHGRRDSRHMSLEGELPDVEGMRH